jgi:hypothetical protein
MRTSFHHQPEAQHQKSPAIETPVGRLPHLYSVSDHFGPGADWPLSAKGRHHADCLHGNVRKATGAPLSADVLIGEEMSIAAFAAARGPGRGRCR